MKKVVYLLIFIFVILIIFIFAKSRISTPSLFQKQVNIPTDILARTGQGCTLSTSIPKRITGMSYFAIPGQVTEQEYDLLASLGVKTVRLDFGWKYIEQADGSDRFDDYDTIIAALAKRHITVSDALINNEPETLNSWENATTKMYSFTTQIVKRYKPEGVYAKLNPEFVGIRHWEIFNEPNLPGVGFIPNNVSAKDFIDGYISMLIAANRAVHSEDPKAFVISGGLSPDGAPPYEFLARMLTVAPNCFDIMAFHPYGDPKNFQATADHLRSIMAEHGVHGRPIWFNEYGTDDDHERTSLIPPAFAEANKSAEGFFWFTLRDFSRVTGKFGVLNYDLSTKTSYMLLKNAFMNSARCDLTLENNCSVSHFNTKDPIVHDQAVGSARGD